MLLKAALPSIPVVNQLPGVRKTGGDPSSLHELRTAPDEPAEGARREPPDARDVRAERTSVDSQLVELLVEHVLRHAVEEQVHGQDHDHQVVQPADERQVVRHEIAAHDQIAERPREHHLATGGCPVVADELEEQPAVDRGAARERH